LTPYACAISFKYLVTASCQRDGESEPYNIREHDTGARDAASAGRDQQACDLWQAGRPVAGGRITQKAGMCRRMRDRNVVQEKTGGSEAAAAA
jgi:hypothetical protein